MVKKQGAEVALYNFNEIIYLLVILLIIGLNLLQVLLLQSFKLMFLNETWGVQS